MAKRAFIVGVNTHGLQYSENDADLMEQCLKKYGYEIIRPRDPKKSEVTDGFESMLDECKQTDTVIVYFSGHAVIEAGELQFILDDTANKITSKITLNVIVKTFEKCKRVSHKLVILDCCNAGTSHARWNSDFLDKYYILTSSGEFEKTRELDELKAGFLTYHIHNALLNPSPEFLDDDNKIRVVDFYNWLKRQAEHHNGTENSVKVSIPHLFGNSIANFDIATVSQSIISKQTRRKKQTKEKTDKTGDSGESFIEPAKEKSYWLKIRQVIINMLLIVILAVGIAVWVIVDKSSDICTVAFIALDAHTHKPVSNAKVSFAYGLDSRLETTDSEGNYKADLPCDKDKSFVRVRVEAAGYTAYSRNFNLMSEINKVEEIYLQPLDLDSEHIDPEPTLPQTDEAVQQLLFSGSKLLKAGAIEAAEKEFDEARRHAPEAPEPLYWKASIAFARNNKSVALAYLDKALQFSPKHVESLALKIKILLLTGGQKTSMAEQIASQSYGYSKTLDSWLDCLNKHNIFSQIILTNNELEHQCPTP
ncbi:MAG: hypothetical protein GY795_18890 [Desulfobacterales bacterium]|nr:hypothetical protein [Desulfobacterales bacterium]